MRVCKLGQVRFVRFKELGLDFSVCRISGIDGVDFARGFVFLAKTDEELSLVCESAYVPEGALAVEPGWRAFRVEGVLDFGLVGIIAGITGALAGAGISVFVVSTYNTDYVLVKSRDFDRAMELLNQNIK